MEKNESDVNSTIYQVKSEGSEVLLDPKIKKLFDFCLEAHETAYAPYSNFKVGACLLTKDGKYVKGCNIENAVYPLCTCAERTAIAKAVSDGERNFVAIAVTSGRNTVCTPCGSCRQVLAEFCGPKFQVYCVKKDLSYELYTLAQLLPESFNSNVLSAE